jgi:hypothetical protein
MKYRVIHVPLDLLNLAAQQPRQIQQKGAIEYLYGRTETWSVSPSVDMLTFSITIPATVPQRLEIAEGLMNYPVVTTVCFIKKDFV